MFYSIRHVTRFRYSAPIRETVMELRMQPRSEGPQALRSFQLVTNPRAQLYAYTDYAGNAVYHFNVLRAHDELRIEAQAVVEIYRMPPLPEAADSLEWDRYNPYNLSDDHFDLLEPSKFAICSPALVQFMAEKDLTHPKGDPLTALKTLNRTIYRIVRLRIRHHTSAFADRSCVGRKARGLSGFRTHHDCHRAKMGHSGALCVRLSLSSSTKP